MTQLSKLKDIENQAAGMTPAEAVDYLEAVRLEGMAAVEKLIEKYRKKILAQQKEMERLKLMSKYEMEAYQKGFRYVAGIDEAGRGPLAGPVAAACVMLPEGCIIEGVNDSKKLSAAQRERLYDIIVDKAISIGIGIIDEKCIDEINILNATKLAMKKAVDQIKPRPDMLLIDAVRLNDVEIRQMPIIKGDALSISIAAASIIAKVTRDRLIEQADAIYPQYGFKKHKGYGTEEHINAIKKYGICPIHRVSFTKNL
ncbi:MAG: ribonuclease HII [Clostridiaceae bacterium]